MALIYWIHRKENEDYLTEGYIGITDRTLEERLLDHKREAPNKHFQNAINKYGWDNLIKEVIFEGSEEDCLLFENYLRAEECVGWNVAIGGGKPPGMYGKQHKNETKIKQSESHKGVLKSEEQKLKSTLTKLNMSKDVFEQLILCIKNNERNIDIVNRFGVGRNFVTKYKKLYNIKSLKNQTESHKIKHALKKLNMDLLTYNKMIEDIKSKSSVKYLVSKYNIGETTARRYLSNYKFL